MMERAPETFDWVSARAKCSLGPLFTLLTEVMDSDVRTRQTTAREGEQFALHRLTNDKVSVSRLWREGPLRHEDGVVFDLYNGSLQVKSAKGEVLFKATASLDANGLCRFEIEGNPMELWQVSRRALEALFFSS